MARTHLLENEKGFTFVDVLVASALLVSGALFIISSAAQSAEAAKAAMVSAARENLTVKIRRYANLPASLKASAATPVNVDLENCLYATNRRGDGSSGPCRQDVAMPLTLHSPWDSEPVAGGPLAPAAPPPAAFDVFGNTCIARNPAGTAPAATCPWVAVGSFIAKCPANSGTCAVAQSVQVRISIRWNPEYNGANRVSEQKFVGQEFSGLFLEVPEILAAVY
jgi:hypothetical protein